jgi:hypothetical protein
LLFPQLIPLGEIREHACSKSFVKNRAEGFCMLRSDFCISLRPMPFQQRTNTSCYLAIPTHGFTVVLSVFWGTPPAKPLNCKSVSNRLGARIRSCGHTTSVERLGIPATDFVWHSQTSSRRRSRFTHSSIAFRSDCLPSHIRQQKTLLTLW